MSNRKLRVKSLPDLIKALMDKGYVFEPYPGNSSLIVMRNETYRNFISTEIINLCGQAVTEHESGTLTAYDPVKRCKWIVSEAMCEEV